METIQIVGSLISSVGFPIVACGALFWMMWHDKKETGKQIEALKTSLDANTRVLERLEIRMENNKYE